MYGFAAQNGILRPRLAQVTHIQLAATRAACGAGRGEGGAGGGQRVGAGQPDLADDEALRGAASRAIALPATGARSAPFARLEAFVHMAAKQSRNRIDRIAARGEQLVVARGSFGRARGRGAARRLTKPQRVPSPLMRAGQGWGRACSRRLQVLSDRETTGRFAGPSDEPPFNPYTACIGSQLIAD